MSQSLIKRWRDARRAARRAIGPAATEAAERTIRGIERSMTVKQLAQVQAEKGDV